ncbi:MAG: sodium ion-translocating decarboxylase subunit beta, partial [Chloroflexota bacterium]|nr:sodium ion-translocating decarboxylase subunit beta [Chloroflexota bacterium]
MDWTLLQGLFEGFQGMADPGIFLMLAIGGLLIYLGIAKNYEPLLLIGIGTGIVLANLPIGDLTKEATPNEIGGLLWYFKKYLIETEIVPLLIFLGLGALTDFEPILSHPYTILLGAAAQLGVFVALVGALVMGLGFGLREAASIGIIGGADGPTTIYVATKMREMGGQDILGAVAVAAYSYMALVPIIQPPIIRLLTTREERLVRMPYTTRPVSRTAKILFPIVLTLVVGVLVPHATPLIGIFAFGNLLRESGVVERLAGTAQNELMNIVTIILGVTVGSTMPAAIFLKPQTLAIFVLGLFAFGVSTAGGVM